MKSASLNDSEMAIIKKGLAELEAEASQVSQKQRQILDEEKKMPLNVDTISQAGFSKSIINKPMSRKNDNLTEEERENNMKVSRKQD